MNRIAEAFRNHKAFIAFITVGDPDLEATEQIVRAAVEGGADLIELGIPFSDPTAEGPVIMHADQVALEAGTTTDKVFALTKRLRETVTVPMVYMTYANVVFSYGTEKFAVRAAEAGIDGVILPDVPYEEKEEFDGVFSRYGIDLISMIAPTSENRITRIAGEAKGFVYMVSSLGVTGTRSEITTDIGAMTALVRKAAKVPCAVGFGIQTPEQAAKMASLSDGAIVGSAIIKIIDQYGTEAAPHVRAYVQSMADAVHAVKDSVHGA
ncbi:MAG: tryptophan synthase subunit alpha [Lachnospiraceae bacterium]|jgi:tryptophan synthase alpha chain|nr:tryptophan synthase subunit alpha [Lachnospiraceae bacterium]